MTLPEALALVQDEATYASEKHHRFHSGHEGYAVVLEELDELWDAVKTDKQYVRYTGMAASEAVQVAAMAVRFLVDLCDHEGTAAYLSGKRGRA